MTPAERAFLTELADTHRAADLGPAGTAADTVVSGMWAALATGERAHLLLQLACRTRVPRMPFAEPHDDATTEAYDLHGQARGNSASVEDFCGAGPDDVPGLRHPAAQAAIALSGPDDAELALNVAVLLHDFAVTSCSGPRTPPPRGRGRTVAGGRTDRSAA